MKIGIAGAGKIVRECLGVLRDDAEISCQAIWNRTREKAQSLADEFEIPDVYEDWEAMLADERLDFIYIGLSNDAHYPFALQALQAGHNVILEKPFTTTLQQAEELAACANAHDLYLFEAISSVHTEHFDFVRSHVSDLGDIKLVLCNYSQYSTRYDDYLKGKVHTVFDPNRDGGTLVDLNVYNIHIVVALFGMPQEVDYRPNFGWNGVDTSGVLLLTYPAFTAVCFAAKDSRSPSFIDIQGNRGTVMIDGYANACQTIRWMEGENKIETRTTAWHRMKGEFLAFERIWHDQDRKSCQRLLENSLMVTRVLCEARAQTQRLRP